MNTSFSSKSSRSSVDRSFSSSSVKSRAESPKPLQLQQPQVPQFTHLEHLCSLNINWKAHVVRKTGIICTLGPASQSVEVIQKLIDAGMTIARLNFSHANYTYHESIINAVREAAEKFSMRRVVAIALDTKGPEIRTGILETGLDTEMDLKTGEQICVTTNDSYKEKCSKSFLYVDYKNMPLVIVPFSKIFIDDGSICLIVEKIENDDIFCKIVNGGTLGSTKGVNLPGINVDLPAISEKDIRNLKFGVSKNVDMIFASFVRNATVVKMIRKHLGSQGKDIKIVAKVENFEGVNNIDEIIAEADGIMIARGDLGIEIPPEKVFLAQKMIIAKCNRAGKPVICSTQMLESMTKKPRPTRAEGTDVANAVLDGVDCVMLSNETAKGDYPVETVRTMQNICREAESAVYHVKFFEELQRLTPLPTDIAQTMAVSSVSSAVMCRSSAILVLALTGKTTQLISKYRPPCPIICVTTDEGVARRLLLYRAIIPLLYKDVRNLEWPYDVDDRIKFGLTIAKERNIVKLNDKVVIVTGWRQKADFSNSVRVLIVSKDQGF